MKKYEKIEVRCKNCNKKIFEYVSGENVCIRLKCVRCDRFAIMREDSKTIYEKAINGVLKI